MAVHPLAGFLSVEESAGRIRHYRYAEERMMRVLGGWIALTPELSAKLLLGRHVWDCAQHADLWGKRLAELRAPAQVSEPPNEAFVRFMDRLESPEEFHQTPERLVGVYRVLKPHLLATYEEHVGRANAVYEPPTRRILQRTIDDERRHITAGSMVLSHVLTTPELQERARGWQRELEGLLEEAGGVSGRGTASPAPADAVPDAAGIAQDLVSLERPVGRWPIPPELEASVEAHARHLVSRDLRALEPDFAASYRDTGMAVYASLAATAFARHRVVGFATLGGQRLVKVRLEGPARIAVLQLRWGDQDGRWQVLEAEVVRTEGNSGS
ncbi:MAG: hypothetical protein HY726_21540 [Candidatus Rokubacteria bacterium]|nr:hypothetical protein [Candidatus Rokubacteria bacterium]